jgi:hypothetical protein
MHLVDNPDRPRARLRPAAPDYAEKSDLPRPVGSRGHGSHPASGPLESLPSDHSLSERVLLRGYGLDPDNLELELIERRP